MTFPICLPVLALNKQYGSTGFEFANLDFLIPIAETINSSGFIDPTTDTLVSAQVDVIGLRYDGLQVSVGGVPLAGGPRKLTITDTAGRQVEPYSQSATIGSKIAGVNVFFSLTQYDQEGINLILGGSQVTKLDGQFPAPNRAIAGVSEPPAANDPAWFRMSICSCVVHRAAGKPTGPKPPKTGSSFPKPPGVPGVPGRGEPCAVTVPYISQGEDLDCWSEVDFGPTSAPAQMRGFRPLIFKDSAFDQDKGAFAIKSSQVGPPSAGHDYEFSLLYSSDNGVSWAFAFGAARRDVGVGVNYSYFQNGPGIPATFDYTKGQLAMSYLVRPKPGTTLIIEKIGLADQAIPFTD